MSDSDLISRQEARDLAEAAHAAFLIYREFSQEQVDAVVAAMAAAGLRESERLARMAVEETGYGRVKDKQAKNVLVSKNLHDYIRGIRTVGVLNESASVIEIAEPVGVVAAIVPSTNPTSTVIYKCLIAVKARNAIVVSPHPTARACCIETARVLAEAAEAAGAPRGIIGCMQTPTLEGSQELMSHKRVAVILATGGPGIVKAAYSSGKPAFGVGPGNVPVYVDRSADVAKAARDVLAGKTFDYGTVCASEQAVIVDAPVKEQVIEELVRNGGYFLSGAEIEKINSIILTPSGAINPDLVGRSPQVIARRAGFEVPETVEALIAALPGVGREYPLSREKLSPILAFYAVNGWREGCEMCKRILELGGMGHTLGIHATDRDVIMAFGLEKPAFRIIVNSPTTHGAVGYTTDLPPAMTLGCGAMGNNITSDNIGPLHLLNVKRVAFETKPLALTSMDGTISAGPARDSTHVVGGGLPSGADIAKRVQSYLDSKGVFQGHAHHLCPTASPPLSPTPAPRRGAPESPAPKPVDFVCEADVRKAVESGEKIIVGPRTIITPAARDLGNEKKIFA